MVVHNIFNSYYLYPIFVVVSDQFIFLFCFLCVIVFEFLVIVCALLVWGGQEFTARNRGNAVFMNYIQKYKFNRLRYLKEWIIWLTGRVITTTRKKSILTFKKLKSLYDNSLGKFQISEVDPWTRTLILLDVGPFDIPLSAHELIKTYIKWVTIIISDTKTGIRISYI